MPPSVTDPDLNRKRFFLSKILSKLPHLKNRIINHLQIHLIERKCLDFDNISDTDSDFTIETPLGNPLSDANVGIAKLWSQKERQIVNKHIIERAIECISLKDLEEIINLVRKEDTVISLEKMINIRNESFKKVHGKLKEFCDLPLGHLQVKEEKAIGLRVALINRFISDHIQFVTIAKHYITIRDIKNIVDSIISTPSGRGIIGGKAAGFLLAHRILCKPYSNDPIDDLDRRIHLPESVFISTDIFNKFIKHNGFDDFWSHKYKSQSQIEEQYPYIRAMFKNGKFPRSVVKQLRKVLRKWNDHPLIVRSSSLLEDNFGTPFPGMYESIYILNHGPLEDRLRDLMGAIAEVYASTIGPNPIAYRRERDLIDYDEKMGIIIQKVVGKRYRHYFLPLFAGVAFSRNEYIWTKRLKPEDGMLRVVFGLGTHAVDRVAHDHPRIVGLTVPTLRPEVDADRITKYSQRLCDVINYETGKFERVPIEDLLDEEEYPKHLDQVMSISSDGMLRRPLGKIMDTPKRQLVATFDKLLRGKFPTFITTALKKLEAIYKTPLDIEFASDGEKFYLLQCRPLTTWQSTEKISMPTDIPPERLIFTSNRFVQNGVIKNVEYVIYVDPKIYYSIQSLDEKATLSQVISALNARLEGCSFIMIGPGRWGSVNINLGIQIRYSDVNHTKALIEIASEKEGYVPEVSFGTHFFQDLVDGHIYILALYPDAHDSVFNADFFNRSDNELASLLPTYEQYTEYVKVINVNEHTDGQFLHVLMDGTEQKTVAYLGPKLS